ncbi:MAG TPA: retropepsin-like aspartic protease [Flavobacterium sp.]|nr:retropepsin-like aspartic protease [Flavobacterium sp.]
MDKIFDALKAEGYKKIKLKVSKTHHLLIRAKINGIEGNFILDTGASSSCVGFGDISFFNLKAEESPTKASGAGAVGMDTQMSSNNTLQLGRWKTDDFSLVIFNMSHVNLALEQYHAKPVHGIIGADVLMKGKGVIDYQGEFFYLK